MQNSVPLLFDKNRRFLKRSVIGPSGEIPNTTKMELNNSDRSEIYQDRELLDAVLQKKDEHCRLNDSDGSRLSSMFPLRSTGNLSLSRPPSFVSKRSNALSQERLSDPGVPNFFDVDKEDYLLVKRTLHLLSLLCLCALVVGLLSIQLLLSISDSQLTMSTGLALVDANVTNDDVVEVATAMCTFVIVLNAMCLLICSVQCFIVVKLLRVPIGKARALKYLKDCASSRFVAIAGFFVSIPVLLISLMLFMVIRFRSKPAIIACVILSAGIIFGILGVVQNTYHWIKEKHRATKGLPVYDSQAEVQDGTEVLPGKELSTLV